MDCDHEATLSEMEHHSVRHHTRRRVSDIVISHATDIFTFLRVEFMECTLHNGMAISVTIHSLQFTKAAFVILKATSLNAVGSFTISLFFLFASCSLIRLAWRRIATMTMLYRYTPYESNSDNIIFSKSCQ